MKQKICRNLRGACAAVIPGEMLVAMVKSVSNMSRKGSRWADVREGGLNNHAGFHAHQRQRTSTVAPVGRRFKIKRKNGRGATGAATGAMASWMRTACRASQPGLTGCRLACTMRSRKCGLR